MKVGLRLQLTELGFVDLVCLSSTAGWRFTAPPTPKWFPPEMARRAGGGTDVGRPLIRCPRSSPSPIESPTIENQIVYSVDEIYVAI
jgi:hypothetical protein